MTARTPDFRILLEGKDLTNTIEPRLQGLTVTECRQDEADTLDLTPVSYTHLTLPTICSV